MDHVVRGPDGTRDHRPRPARTSAASPSPPAGARAAAAAGQVPRLRLVARRSLPALRDQVAAALAAARYTGWEGLLREQREYLDEFWASADVEVDGDAELQQAVRFALFHVLQAGARAERRPIPAKGLTGPGYDGHTFWDTETFCCRCSPTPSPTPRRTRCAGASRPCRWPASGPSSSA